MNALQKLQQRCGSGEGRALYELIMERRFGLSRTDILLGKDTTLSAKDNEELQIIVDRVAKGEPVQYVLGSEEFCGREFLVRPGVLIPRPETQQLVRLVRQNVPIGSTVLDIGTGSGCIAITLALAGYKVTALDVSDEALAVAKQNAERLGAEVELVKGDIKAPFCSPFGGVSKPQTSSSLKHSPKGGAGRGLACIVSNPPYICESEAAAMDANVLDHEPHLALFVPDGDPLLFYKAISEFGQEHLADEGLLFFEVNRAYAEQVAELLLQKGYEDAKVVKDDYENNRFVWARKIQD
jgi:release factor glutamine methyltransferase